MKPQTQDFTQCLTFVKFLSGYYLDQNHSHSRLNNDLASTFGSIWPALTQKCKRKMCYKLCKTQEDQIIILFVVNLPILALPPLLLASFCSLYLLHLFSFQLLIQQPFKKYKISVQS